MELVELYKKAALMANIGAYRDAAVLYNEFLTKGDALQDSADWPV